MSKAATLPPSRRLTPSSRAKVISALAERSAPSGRARTWPVLKVKFQRRLPIHSASRSCGFSAGAAAISACRATTCCPAPSPETTSLPWARAGPTTSSSWPVASISTSLSTLRSTAAGLRSTMSITSVSGSWRETRASSTHESWSSSARNAATSTMVMARSRSASARS